MAVPQIRDGTEQEPCSLVGSWRGLLAAIESIVANAAGGEKSMRRKPARSSSQPVPGTHSPRQSGDADETYSPPALLTRTSVYKRLPDSLRNQLDQALLERPKDCATLNAVARKFQLAQRFGITTRALRAYAAKLDQLAEPVYAGRLVNSLLECLPDARPAELTDGGDVMLISRVVQALTQKDKKLAAPDLARAALLFGSNAAKQRLTSCKKEGYTDQGKPNRSPAEASPAQSRPDNLAESVRMVYGLGWPSESRP
jgi:hypothetical protein